MMVSSNDARMVATILMNRAIPGKNVKTFVNVLKAKIATPANVAEFLPLILSWSSVPRQTMDELFDALGPRALKAYKTHPLVEQWAYPKFAMAYISRDTAALQEIWTILPKKQALEALYQQSAFMRTSFAYIFDTVKTKLTREHKKEMDFHIDIAISAKLTSTFANVYYTALLDTFAQYSGDLQRKHMAVFWELFDFQRGRLGPLKSLRVGGIWVDNQPRMGTPIHYIVSMYTHGRFILTHGTRYLALQDLLHGLVSRGVSIDATDSRGDTALHYAAARTLQTNEIMVRGLVAELLIMLGARYTIANANGRTVRQLMPEHSWMFTASNIKRQRHGSANTRQTKKVKR
jgi:hypothetical protein